MNNVESPMAASCNGCVVEKTSALPKLYFLQIVLYFLQ